MDLVKFGIRMLHEALDSKDEDGWEKAVGMVIAKGLQITDPTFTAQCREKVEGHMRKYYKKKAQRHAENYRSRLTKCESIVVCICCWMVIANRGRGVLGCLLAIRRC